MRRVSPEVREVARQLVCACATGDPVTSRTSVEALRRALAPLRTRLVPLVGTEGFSALIRRTLALAKDELPWLATVERDPDALLDGLDDIGAGHDPKEVQAACTAVLAALLTLLISFIGRELTRQIASAAWPDLPLRDMEFGAEEGDV